MVFHVVLMDFEGFRVVSRPRKAPKVVPGAMFVHVLLSRRAGEGARELRSGRPSAAADEVRAAHVA